MPLVLAGCGAEPAEEKAPGSAPPLQFEMASAGAVAHGERLARVLGCRGCHGDDLTGRPWIEDSEVAILFTSNLTRAVPAYSDAALAQTIRNGARPDGSPLWDMPSSLFTDLADADMAALIAYLRTVPPSGQTHPRIVIGPEGRREIEAGTIRPEPAVVQSSRGKGPPPLDGRHDWARYMIRATCSECHGLDLAGHEGREGRPGPPDLLVAGGYSREQLRHLLRTGAPPDGRRLGLMADVARGRFAHMTPREIDAIYDYLAARAARPQ